MKKQILIIAILFTAFINAQNQLRAPEKEFVIANIHLDYPETLNPHKAERGVQYNIEFGIMGSVGNFIGMEAKVGYDNFSSLLGGYEAFTGGYGIRMVSGYEEEWNYYIGGRASKVYRTNQYNIRGYRWVPGLEVKVTRDINDWFFAGLRYTLDRAYDQELFDWNVENRYAVFLTLGFKIKRL